MGGLVPTSRSIPAGGDGSEAKEILRALRTHGCYVLTGVLSAEEVADLQAKLPEVLEYAPAHTGSPVDRHGRPVKFADHYNLSLALPARRRGAEPETGQQVVGAIYHPLMALDSALRLAALRLSAHRRRRHGLVYTSDAADE